MTRSSAQLTGSILLLGICASSLAAGGPSRVCELAVKRGGLVEYMVQVDPDRNGSRTIQADFDLDGSVDELRWFDPRSASVTPAGNATLTLAVASNSKTYKLEQQRIGVVKFESHYYVVTTRVDSELGPWYREVFAITQDGFTKICAFDGKGQGP